MLIAIDGACKRNGQETCSSTGVAWIQTDQGDMLFKSKFEPQSTSQRGEINGLLEALKYAYATRKPDEDIIIVTDSEYLYNTVSLDWVHKWKQSNWIGGQGTTVKNNDMWNEVCDLLDKINGKSEFVFMQWTKGHLMSYTPGNVKQALAVDPEGIELFTRIIAVATRECNKDRIINDFMRNRIEHDKSNPPPQVCLDWVVANTMADCLALFIEGAMDALAY